MTIPLSNYEVITVTDRLNLGYVMARSIARIFDSHRLDFEPWHFKQVLHSYLLLLQMR